MGKPGESQAKQDGQQPFLGKLLLKIPSGKQQVALTELIADSPFSV